MCAKFGALGQQVMIIAISHLNSLPAMRLYISLVAVGVQEQAEDILVLPLL